MTNLCLQPGSVVEVKQYVPGPLNALEQYPVGPIGLAVPGSPGPPGESGLGALQAHIEDSTPHPAYDDLPSLSLLFENHLI